MPCSFLERIYDEWNRESKIQGQVGKAVKRDEGNKENVKKGQ
jgi:hypothetical protein